MTNIATTVVACINSISDDLDNSLSSLFHVEYFVWINASQVSLHFVLLRENRACKLSFHCTSRCSCLCSGKILVFLRMSDKILFISVQCKNLAWKMISWTSDKIHVDRILPDESRIRPPGKILVLTIQIRFLLLDFLVCFFLYWLSCVLLPFLIFLSDSFLWHISPI